MIDYIKLTPDELKERITLLVDLWGAFLEDIKPIYIDSFEKRKDSIENMKIEELYDVNLFALKEAFERTHQREDYFKRYHNRLIMSDFKEIGLIAYWIVKFKPYHLNAKLFNEAFALRINEEFALYFIFNTIAKYTKGKGEDYHLDCINSDLYNELLYTMQYRDLSKEAYGCIAELIYLAIKSN